MGGGVCQVRQYGAGRSNIWVCHGSDMPGEMQIKRSDIGLAISKKGLGKMARQVWYMRLAGPAYGFGRVQHMGPACHTLF